MGKPQAATRLGRCREVPKGAPKTFRGSRPEPPGKTTSSQSGLAPSLGNTKRGARAWLKRRFLKALRNPICGMRDLWNAGQASDDTGSGDFQDQAPSQMGPLCGQQCMLRRPGTRMHESEEEGSWANHKQQPAWGGSREVPNGAPNTFRGSRPESLVKITSSQSGLTPV